MRKIKVVTVFGTRPDAIKMVPLIRELEKCKQISPIVCVTAQHREMLDQVLEKFDVKPDFDLNIMKERQTLEHITSKALEGLSEVFGKVQPDIVLVHGDTTTTFAGSLAAFYKNIKVGHVEAGLRTYDKYFPYPEEMNRKLTGVIADLHFAPTAANMENLVNERINKESIYITGNTAIDVLKYTVQEDYTFDCSELNNIDYKCKRVIAMEVHRRENLGKPIKDICMAVKHIADIYEDVEVVYTVHLNPAVQEAASEVLGNHPRVRLVKPLDVYDMHNLMKRSYMVVTDSGGLQDEVPSLGTPVLVTRNETERQEAIQAGTVKLAGTNYDQIVFHIKQLLDDPVEYNKMAKAVNPYGDGKASERIVKALLYEFGLSKERPQDIIVR